MNQDSTALRPGTARVYAAVADALVGSGVSRLALRHRPEESRERHGESPPSGIDRPLWIHAASLGETRAAGALLRELRARGEKPLALSATTTAGVTRAAELTPDLPAFYFPLDAPSVVRRSLDRLNPRGFLVVEKELWPNLLHELGRRRTPWAMVSARLSERGQRRMSWTPKFWQNVLQGMNALAARSEEDAARYIALGAPPARVRVTGDLKESLEVPEFTLPLADRFTWVAACTRPGEEEIVIQAARLLAHEIPEARTFLAPRHADRFEEVGRLLTRKDCNFVRWSEGGDLPSVSHQPLGKAGTAGANTVLVDALGVLETVYHRAHVAFVGGSLARLGGHNPLEAAAQGRGVFMGPHTANCQRAFDALVAGGAARTVTTAEGLAQELVLLARDPGEVERRGRAARGVAARSSSAARDTVDWLTACGVLAP